MYQNASELWIVYITSVAAAHQFKALVCDGTHGRSPVPPGSNHHGAGIKVFFSQKSFFHKFLRRLQGLVTCQYLGSL